MNDSHIASPDLQRSNYLLLRTSGLHCPRRLCDPPGVLYFRSRLRRKEQTLGSPLAHEVETLVIVREDICFINYFSFKEPRSRGRHWEKWEEKGGLGAWALIALDRLPGARMLVF